MLVSQLKALAKRRKLSGYSKLNKKQLERLLSVRSVRSKKGKASKGGKESKGGKRSKTAVVYTLQGCPWCTKVKALLRAKKYKIRTIQTTRTAKVRPAMPNGKTPATYPQVWIGGKLYGGYESTANKLK